MKSATSKSTAKTTKKSTRSPVRAASVNSTENAQLPGVVELLRQSWQLVTRRFGALLGLSVINFVLQVSLVVVAVMAALFVGANTAIQGYQAGLSIQELITPELIQTLGIFVVLLIAALVVESLLVQMTTLRVLFNPAESIMEAFRRSVSKFWPVLGASVLVMVMTVGGFWLFVIPGFVFSLWFMFVVYEVVLYDAPVMVALDRSAAVVRTHFWGIFGRFVALLLLTMIIGAVFDELAVSLSEDLKAAADVAGLLYQALIGWIWLAFVGKLYQGIRQTSVTPQSAKLALVVAGIGWLCAGVVLWNAVQRSDILNSELLNPATFLSETELFPEASVEEVPLNSDEMQLDNSGMTEPVGSENPVY